MDEKLLLNKMLPVDLIKLILSYLNYNNNLLLNHLIDYANERIIGFNTDRPIMADISSAFTNIGFINKIEYGYDPNTYTLSLNQTGYVSKQQIINLIDTLFNSLKQLYRHINLGTNADETLFIINKLLYKYKFNNYLLIMFNDNDDQLIYKWLRL